MEQTYNSTMNTSPAGGPPPKNWLVESILVTIFCCLPFGIVGIINAANVNSSIARGDYAGALDASQKAGKWTKIGFFVGLGGIVLYILFMFVFGGLAMMNAASQ
ncbi:CD225/dispanin family protein [Hymenobacter guriensis]|uniref:CD225/dispanin family protein n=1 Tax=Hymenobacter guriensis TaxID=2793065 RepID=A0ABS0L6Y8_9BACT|nr:CD225/dispanin family protein [Hymenobacter guriensis]MBG8555164.1 CD225/dispanin family protein [Hymenobacter guriensis]